MYVEVQDSTMPFSWCFQGQSQQYRNLSPNCRKSISARDGGVVNSRRCPESCFCCSSVQRDILPENCPIEKHFPSLTGGMIRLDLVLISTTVSESQRFFQNSLVYMNWGL